MTAYHDRLKRAQEIIGALEADRDSTCAQEAARQLRTLVRRAERLYNLTKEDAARNALRWAI